MPMFRKKPVIIEARQWDGTVDSANEICAWSEGKVSFNKIMIIETLEGVMAASPNDWIIQGVNKEFYPCKPDIFEKTYEKV
jgi:hypothetical protein